MNEALDVWVRGGAPWWLTAVGWIVSGGLTLAGVMFAQWRSDTRESRKTAEQSDRERVREAEQWERERARWDYEADRWQREQQARYRDRQLLAFTRLIQPMMRLERPLRHVWSISALDISSPSPDYISAVRKIMASDNDLQSAMADARAVLGEVTLICSKEVRRAIGGMIYLGQLFIGELSSFDKSSDNARSDSVRIVDLANRISRQRDRCLALMQIELGLLPASDAAIQEGEDPVEAERPVWW